MARRFERLLDPCGNWTIWDRSIDLPATYQGRVLEGLAAEDAKRISSLLNVMHDMETADITTAKRRVGKHDGAA